MQQKGVRTIVNIDIHVCVIELVDVLKMATPLVGII